MLAILSLIVLPTVTKGHGAFSRLLCATRDVVAGYLGRRTATAYLHDLDDRVLRNIADDYQRRAEQASRAVVPG